MGDIYLIRHGQASFGAENYDVLSELGAHQSLVAGAYWRDVIGQVDVAIGGTMSRHATTYLNFADGFGEMPQLQVDGGFDEYDFQAVLAAARPEFAERAALGQWLAAQDNPRQAFQDVFAKAARRWASGAHDGDYVESFAAFRARVNGSMAALHERLGRGETACVFTSGGPIGIVVQSLLQIPDEQVFELNWTMANTSVTRVLYSSSRMSLSFVNNYAHVFGAPELLTYR